MARASPLVRSFNAGELSVLMEGRTDIDRYPASNRKLLNCIAAPQGPAITRSGTEFVNTVYQNLVSSTLIPFVFDDDTDFYMLEFGELRLRFFTEDGILTYAPVAGTVTSTNPFKIDSAAIGANVGDEVAYGSFANNYNLNGVVGKITAKVGTVYTFDTVFPALAIPGAPITVARVYHIVSPYTAAQAKKIKETQSLDTLFLTCKGVKPYKLQRSDTYSWAFTAIVYTDGPYMPVNEGNNTTLKWSVTGKATPDMTSDILPAGSTATGSLEVAGHEFYRAFEDMTKVTYWDSNANQVGTLEYDTTAPFICDGYTIHIANDNQNATYTAKDYAPSDWTFEGWDGAAWVVLDRQNDYVLYNSHKSVFFPLPNTVAYAKYRLVVSTLTRNGTQNLRIRRLVMRSTTSVTMTITASDTAGINNGVGFLATDVGRLLRIKGGDGSWRNLLITAWTSATIVTAKLLGEPFSDLQPTTFWRLGYWSDTTGYPFYSYFYQDRLWYAGSDVFPDLLVASTSGRYDNMSPTAFDGSVLDTNSIAVRLNSRKLARIRWMSGGKDGLLLGTGSQEYVIRSADVSNKTITPANIKADESTARGSADVRPAAIDTQVLYVPRGGRGLREYAFSFEADGYKSPSMSTLSSHLGASPFRQLAYASEPYSIVWVLRADGRLVGLTYNREENVIGWHRHKFPDIMVGDVELEGVIECIAVMPSSDQLQDVLWMIVKREVQGVEKRYVEKLTRFWDFDMTIDDAHFVDCALRYVGAPTQDIYGLEHLNGYTNVYGLSDGNPIGPFTVNNGHVHLPEMGSNVVLGIGFDAEGETSRLENGAADGTAQGKSKRIHNCSALIWDTYGGEIGTWNEDTNEVVYEPIEVPPLDPEQLEQVYLFSGIIGPLTMQRGYEKTGSISFRRKKDQPLPFNIVALMPQMDTQDRG